MPSAPSSTALGVFQSAIDVADVACTDHAGTAALSSSVVFGVSGREGRQADGCRPRAAAVATSATALEHVIARSAHRRYREHQDRLAGRELAEARRPSRRRASPARRGCARGCSPAALRRRSLVGASASPAICSEARCVMPPASDHDDEHRGDDSHRRRGDPHPPLRSERGEQPRRAAGSSRSSPP